jgi:hypothetical protein
MDWSQEEGGIMTIFHATVKTGVNRRIENPPPRYYDARVQARNPIAQRKMELMKQLPIPRKRQHLAWKAHTLLGCLGALAILASAVPASAGGHAPQVLVEGGLVMPHGDLNDDFIKTRLGFGSDNGYEAGFRFRLNLSPTFSVSPSFHFVDFGNFNGEDAEIGEYRILTSSLRYAVEFMVMSENRSWGRPRPFLAAGVGMYRNRAQGFYQDFVKAIDQSVSTLGVSLRGGVQIIGFELSLVYNINRFNTWQFYQSDYRERYNWDNLGVRIGWIIPIK